MGFRPTLVGAERKPQVDGDDNGEIDEADKKVPDAGAAGEPLFGTNPRQWHCNGRRQGQEKQDS